MSDSSLAWQAMAAAERPASHAAGRLPRVLVLGGGGALGAKVVERLLAQRRFDAVGVWTVQPLTTALRGLVPLAAADWPQFDAGTAVVVFDRARHANGREAAFGRPQPEQLPALAAQLRALDFGALVVVVPHAPGLLPQALKLGLASLDEAAVAALGFRHLVFMRAAQAGAASAAAPTSGARLARWLLGQLHWMVPASDQPVRTDTVARVAARLALALPQSAPGTRVLPPELLWAAAQSPASDAVVDAWLAQGARQGSQSGPPPII